MSRLGKLAHRSLLFVAVLALSLGTVKIAFATTVVWSGNVSLPAGYTIPAGVLVQFNPAVTTTVTASKNVIVQGVLQMHPANDGIVHTLRFTGVNEAGFVGGGDVPLSSDVGLWVTGAGQLDIVGAPKLAWARATASLSAGATSVTLDAVPAGWKAGDEIVLAPTESPKVGQFSMHHEVRTITSVIGSTVGFAPLSYPHPRVTVKPGVSYGAEVANLTRNARVEGQDPTHRTHVWAKSSAIQNVRYAAIRYVGPQKGGNEIKGRYGLHFHRMGEGSRGSVVEGTVVRESGSYAFVPHGSNGVTFRNTVAFDSQRAAYWYDSGAAEAPNDTLYDHALAVYVRTVPNDQGMRNTAFFLGRGTGNQCLFCVAAGVQGGKNASGFGWPEGELGIWNFSDGVAHDNIRDGIFVWQNGPEPHVVNRFVGYYNGSAGIEHGAYTNLYTYNDATLYGNLSYGVELWAESKGLPPPTTFARTYIDGGGITQNAYMLGQPANTNNPTVLVCQNTMVGLAPGGTNYLVTYTGEDSTIAERLTVKAVC